MIKNVSERIADELTYQWFREGVDTSTDTEDMTLLEKTRKKIELSPLTLKDKGFYYCVITCDKLREWSIESNSLFVEVEGVCMCVQEKCRLAY